MSFFLLWEKKGEIKIRILFVQLLIAVSANVWNKNYWFIVKTKFQFGFWCLVLIIFLYVYFCLAKVHAEIEVLVLILFSENRNERWFG